MVFAQILNGIIVNVIELDDPQLAPLFAEGFDSCLEIDDLLDNNGNTIGIGWFYDTPSQSFFAAATLALIQNDLVVSVIHNCDAFINENINNYQYIIDITAMNPQPMAGWTYNGTSFTPSTAYYQALIAEAIAFGNQLIIQFSAQNVAAGITQAGQTQAVLNYTEALLSSLQTGSMYLAVSQIMVMINDDSATKTNLAPFVTNDILYNYLNLIQAWLEIPLTPNPGP